ncbi:hypothetical protein V8G54_015880 [Vigna mungo]|uniref:Secreted protein n=1 Tax=Vigna mungo TaxID=3915 RepID=A0AAQ3NLX1_VIGMU
MSTIRFASSPLCCAALPCCCCCCCRRGFRYKFRPVAEFDGATALGRNPNPELTVEGTALRDCSMVALTAGLEKLASRMTLLTLGSSRIDMINCSSSTLTARRGCCCCSG